MAAISAQELTRTRDCIAPGCTDVAASGSDRCKKHQELAVRQGGVLDVLAETARREHVSAGAALASALTHGIRCGEALMEARPLVDALKQTTWGDWVGKNVGLTLDWAGRYMRLASCKDDLPPEAFRAWLDARGRLREPSMAHALSYLTGLPPGEHHWSRKGIDEETRAAVLATLDEGASNNEAAKRHGLSPTTVKRLRNPELEPARREHLNASRREGRQERSDADRAAVEVKLRAGLAVAPAALVNAYERSRDLVMSLRPVAVDYPDADRCARMAHRYLERALIDLAP